MKKIRKGDEVIVLIGKNKGSRGVVTQVMADSRLIVEGINMVKKNTKPNPQVGEPGGIVDREAPIHSSNVAIFNSATNKADRIGIKQLEDGKKVRYFKSNDEVVDI